MRYDSQGLQSMAMLEVLRSALHLILAVDWQAGRQKSACDSCSPCWPAKKSGPQGARSHRLLGVAHPRAHRRVHRLGTWDNQCHAAYAGKL